MQACQVTVSLSYKRKYIAIALLVSILAVFWGLSRYPDLINEYQRARSDTLIERSVGNLSKEELIHSRDKQSNVMVAVSTAVNWLDTNKIGMSFGICFAAAILLLLQQSRILYHAARRRGVKGAFTGFLIGIPLGICTNCATPVSLGLSRSGASPESAFASLIASPSLNPIGLLIIFFLFPAEVGWIRIAVLCPFILLALPLLIWLLGQSPEQRDVTQSHTTEIDESWWQALKYCSRHYGQFFKFIVVKVLPPMLVIGMIAALFVAYYPLENMLLAKTDTLGHIVIAAIIGGLLPMPMFVDIVLVWLLYGYGLPLSLCVTLMLSLAPTSLFALYVMGRNLSWRLSIAVSLSIMLLAMIAGAWMHIEQTKTQALMPVTQFVALDVGEKQGRYNNTRLDNFFAAGVSLIDFDNDGLLDIFVPGDASSALYKNTGNANFIDVTVTSRLKVDRNTVAGIWADYDNDGFLDLLMVNYQDRSGNAEANRLYHNNGDGTFTDVSRKMGLTQKDHSSSAAWADFDNDGDLDLFVSNFGQLDLLAPGKISGKSQFNRLYRNDGERFVEIAESAAVAGQQGNYPKLTVIDKKKTDGDRGFSFQPLWFDFNNDKLIDLFVASDFGSSQLYQNLGAGTFKNVTQSAGIVGYGTGMGATVVDINQDGFFDLYLTNIGVNKLWLNDGKGGFSDVADKFGLDEKNNTSWGVVTFDANNDMRTDMFVINGLVSTFGVQLTNQQQSLSKVVSRNSLFVPVTAANHYQNIAKQAGLFDYSIGRGLAKGDVNNDGFVDLVIANRQSPAVTLYLNQGSDNRGIRIRLQGRESNRHAIGAKVSLYAGGKVQHQLISAGNSFLSQQPNDLYFGLGQAKKIDKITVLWPSGQRQQLFDVAIKPWLQVKEEISEKKMK